MTKTNARPAKSPSPKPHASRAAAGDSSPQCVAVVTPDGRICKLFVQDHAPHEKQEATLLAWAWHNDKPANDYTPCTTPRDTETARKMGYRVVMGRFLPNNPAGG